jgi:hypothetical protein
MLGKEIKSKSGLSFKASTTLTSAPFTAALTAVPVEAPNSMFPPNWDCITWIAFMRIISTANPSSRKKPRSKATKYGTGLGLLEAMPIRTGVNLPMVSAENALVGRAG